MNIPPGVLQAGSNTVTLDRAKWRIRYQPGDYIRITYPHTYAADSDQLKFTGRAGEEIMVERLRQRAYGARYYRSEPCRCS